MDITVTNAAALLTRLARWFMQMQSMIINDQSIMMRWFNHTSQRQTNSDTAMSLLTLAHLSPVWLVTSLTSPLITWTSSWSWDHTHSHTHTTQLFQSGLAKWLSLLMINLCLSSVLIVLHYCRCVHQRPHGGNWWLYRPPASWWLRLCDSKLPQLFPFIYALRSIFGIASLFDSDGWLMGCRCEHELITFILSPTSPSQSW